MAEAADVNTSPAASLEEQKTHILMGHYTRRAAAAASGRESGPAAPGGT